MGLASRYGQAMIHHNALRILLWHLSNLNLVLACQENKGPVDLHERATRFTCNHHGLLSIKICSKKPESNNNTLHSDICLITAIATNSGELFPRVMATMTSNLEDETEFYLGDLWHNYRFVVVAIILSCFDMIATIGEHFSPHRSDQMEFSY